MISTSIAIFGGSFDPVHFGHIAIVNAVQQQLSPKKVIIIPNAVAPHKTQAVASNNQRLQMLKLAFMQHQRIEISDIELKRSGLSYTIDTLDQLKQQYPKSSLLFLMGEDSLFGFTAWHRWQDILQHCHLVIFPRKTITAKSRLVTELSSRIVTTPQHLFSSTTGSIYLLQHTEIPISSTKIRSNLQITQRYLPKTIIDFIQQQHLY